MFREIDHNDKRLNKKAMFVSWCFEDQKNGMVYKSRSHSRSGDPLLCQVIRLVRAVQRVRKFVKNANDDTLLCAINCKHLNGSKFITQEFTLNFLKDTCELFGGKKVFGFTKEMIGNKSIRSGAAMSLFVNNYSPHQIMLLGRWKSLSFLDYLRPQCNELTKGFAKDMVSFDSLVELYPQSKNRKEGQESGVGKHRRFPKFHLRF